MRYLILGGAGFLGTWLANKLLLADGNSTVILFDRKMPDNLPKYCDRIETHIGDFENYERFRNLIKGCDAVFHLISSTIPSKLVNRNSIIPEINENITPTIRLLDACANENIGKFVFLSSGGTVYGNKLETIPIKETNPTNPISAYGIQKLMIEKYIQLYNNAFNLNYQIIRLSNPFGPYQNPFGKQGVLSHFTYRIVNNLPITIYGEGAVIRDFIEVRDAIDMIVNIVNSNKVNEIYNVGSGKGYSVQQCVDLIEEISGKKAKIKKVESRLFDVPVNILDISKYLSDISPIGPKDIKIGIDSLVKYYYNSFQEKEN